LLFELLSIATDVRKSSGGSCLVILAFGAPYERLGSAFRGSEGMKPPADDDGVVRKAVDGDADALGAVLQRFRPYLSILARRHLDSAVNARLDPSDIVQQTCLEACRDLDAFEGTSEGQLIAWLRRILENNVAQSIQTHRVAQKRSVSREQPRALPSDNRSAWADVPADQSSPSRRSLRGELAVRIAREIESLPDDQREAVRLRHLEGRSLAELASHFQRSESAVAGLIKRGLRALRRQLADVAEHGDQ
jgi:RNA polymerase sigma-70 factor (ECF subfamily)